MIAKAGQKQTTPAPMGILETAIVFGIFSLLLWLTVAAVILWLRDLLGVSPIIGWYLSGTVVVLLPILLFGSAMAWRELPAPKMSEWRKRLRLVHMNRGDAIWTIVGLLVILIASAAILALARYLDPSFQPVPWFLAQNPGWHGWGCLSLGFVTNIRRGAVLARLCPTSPAGRYGSASVVGKRNSMVPVPLEPWLADLSDIVVDHLSSPLGCPAEREYLGGNHHSGGFQCRWFCSGCQPARRSIESATPSLTALDSLCLGLISFWANDKFGKPWRTVLMRILH